MDLRVLRPGEKQQKPENGLDIDRHHEKCIDVEVHCLRAPIDDGARLFRRPLPATMEVAPEKSSERA
jgi:hypothetical protein